MNLDQYMKKICIDKVRMIYIIGSVTDKFMTRLEKRIIKNLDIKLNRTIKN